MRVSAVDGKAGGGVDQSDIRVAAGAHFFELSKRPFRYSNSILAGALPGCCCPFFTPVENPSTLPSGHVHRLQADTA